jgi:hypothetical protein
MVNAMGNRPAAATAELELPDVPDAPDAPDAPDNTSAAAAAAAAATAAAASASCLLANRQRRAMAADARAAAFASESRRTTVDATIVQPGADAHMAAPATVAMPPGASLLTPATSTSLGSQQPLEATPCTSGGFRESASTDAARRRRTAAAAIFAERRANYSTSAAGRAEADALASALAAGAANEDDTCLICRIQTATEAIEPCYHVSMCGPCLSQQRQRLRLATADERRYSDAQVHDFQVPVSGLLRCPLCRVLMTR